MSSAEPASVLPIELLHDHKAVGAKVRVFTRFQEVFEGSIFTLDPVAHFLVLGTFSSKLLMEWRFFIETHMFLINYPTK